jgi:protein TonB
LYHYQQPAPTGMEMEAIMYATRTSLPGASRPVSFGAALLFSSAIMAALIFSGPQIFQSLKDKDLTIIDIKDRPPPDPTDPVKPKPHTDQVIDERVITPITDTPIQPDTPHIDTNNVIVGPPPVPLGDGGGTALDPPTPPPPPFRAAESDPRFMKDFQPAYPSIEQRAANEGTVAVRVLIGTDGRVKDVQKISATSDAFFEATRRQALSRWRFRPATRGGVPEESWKTMRVRFQMTGG